MEIEIPRRLARYLIWAAIGIGLFVVGWRVSPIGADGRPLLLTPRLADLAGYRQDAQRWTRILIELDKDFDAILAESSTDLFGQNERIEQAYARLRILITEIEASNVPPVLEQIHILAGNTTSAYLEAAGRTAGWVAEPVEANRQAASDSLNQAHSLLEQLLANPWIENQP